MIFSFKYYICNNSKLAVFPEKWLLFSLQLLFQLIIDYLTDFSFTPAVFEMITEQLKKTYFNILIKPETLAKWVLGEGKRGCAAVVKVEQRAQKSLLCAGGGLFWGGSWPWELRQLCSQCIKLEAQTRPAGSCSSEAASSRGWGRAGWAHSSALGNISPSPVCSWVRSGIACIKQLLVTCGFVFLLFIAGMSVFWF